jgi:hypothetical protein
MRLHDPSVKVWTLILSKILDKTMRRTYKLVCTRSTKFPRLKQRFLRDWGNQWPMRRESSAWASLWRMNPPFGHTTLPKQAPRALCENLLHGRGSRLLHWRPSIRILEPNSASPRRVAGSAVQHQRRRTGTEAWASLLGVRLGYLPVDTQAVAEYGVIWTGVTRGPMLVCHGVPTTR